MAVLQLKQPQRTHHVSASIMSVNADLKTLCSSTGPMISPIVPSQHGLTPPSDVTASTVPTAHPAFANTTVNTTGKQEAAAFNTIAKPVDLHINRKSRAKIQGNS